jgi:hypothetical protein
LICRIIACICSIAAGCSGPSDGPDNGPLDCGVVQAGLDVLTVEGAYASIDANPRAALILGFQGFKMVFLKVRVDRLPPATSGAVVAAVDGEAPFSQSFPELHPHDDGSGALVADPFPLLFNGQTIVELADHGCALTLHVGPSRCEAVATGKVTLGYLDGCVADPAGHITCDDGGAH